MKTNWILRTNGNPLITIRHVIKTLWEKFHLDGIMAPVLESETQRTIPRVLTDPAEVDELNPFFPLMTMNIARLIPDVLANAPGSRFGILVRACELRALREVEKRIGPFNPAPITICVDCLGTYPEQDYAWRLERKGSAFALGEEGLQFARQGGISPYRFRGACQTCLSPGGVGANINIGVIGLPVREYVLVNIPSTGISSILMQNGFGAKPASPDEIELHQRALARVEERQQHVNERLIHELAENLPISIDALIETLESCEACRLCLDACPICRVDPVDRDAEGHYQREDISRWVASCAGCGMCAQACPDHVPLSTIFQNLRRHLAMIH